MNLEAVLEQAGIPLLVFVICIYYGFRVRVHGDLESIRGKNKPLVRDKEMYQKRAGDLILLLGAATLVMAFLLFVSVYAAFVEICISIVLFGILWKSIEERYGAK